MANCPNCGRTTARTKDWCCQWCGYPLFSGSFKTINKTYKELKAERLALEAKEEPEIEEPIEVEPIPAIPVVMPPEKPVETPVMEAVAEEKPDQKAEESSVIKEQETVTTSLQESAPRIIRRVRRISRAPERPVRRRIIRRRRPLERNEEEIEEIVEYIDEEPETEETEIIYEDDDESRYEDEYEDEEYEERPPRQQPRIERRPPPAPGKERIVRYEPAPSVPPPLKKKPVLRPQPEPEVKELFDDIEDEPETEEIEFDDTEEEILDDEEDIEDEDDFEDDEENEDGESDDELSEEEDDFELEEEEQEGKEPEEIPVALTEPSMILTVEDIISAYETEGSNADARFTNQILRVTGIISRVDVRIPMSVYALELEAEETYPLRQTLRCVFNRSQGEALQSLVLDEKVTVQGKYDGSIISITMRDCALIDESE